MPSVSIIIATWNSADFLVSAIDSALAQRDVDIEILVCDDASTDDTQALFSSHKDPRVRYFRSSENQGPGSARNLGLEAATGDWIAILDADDWISPGRSADLIKVADENQADLVADNVFVVPANGLPPRLHIPEQLDGGIEKVTLESYVLRNVMFSSEPSIGYLKPMFKRSFVATHAIRYPEPMRIGEDFAIVAECLARGGKFVRVRSADYFYTSRTGSISFRLKPADLQQMIAYDDGFLRRRGGSIGSEAGRAFATHIGSLRRAEAFLDIVESIKKRRFIELLKLSVRNPMGLMLLRVPVMDRMTALWQRLAGRQMR